MKFRSADYLGSWASALAALALALTTTAPSTAVTAQESSSNVSKLLQTVVSLPVFDLNAAWAQILAQGPTPKDQIPLLAPPRFFPSAALTTIQVSMDKALVYVMRVPAGTWNVNGNLSVGPGQMLIIQGCGGFPEEEQDPGVAPNSIWVVGNTDSSRIFIQPGGVVYMKNMTLVGPVFGPFNTPTTWVPTPVTLPPQAPLSAGLAMEAVSFVLDRCAYLETFQNHACSMLLGDQTVPWPSVESEPGWMVLYRLQSHMANVSIDRAHFTCTWPPPRLYGILRYGSVSPGNMPDAPPVNPALYKASMLSLTPAGFPIQLPTLPPEATTTVNPFSNRRLNCVARRASDARQLSRAVIELQAMSAQFVVVSLVTNMTLNDTMNGTWPTSELALRIYRNVTVQGRHVLTARVTEMDMGNDIRNIFWVDPTAGYLRFQQLTLTNLPCGTRLFFPGSLLAAMMWSVAWDRSRNDRFFVDVRNSTLVLPADNFNYTSYWVGIEASPIPSVRNLASWQTTLAFSGRVTSNDTHVLYMQQRWGRGIVWTNTSLTDLPVVAPLRYRKHGCALQNLVPGDPYYPYTKVTPVFSAPELLSNLHKPLNDVLMLLDNITLSSTGNFTNILLRLSTNPAITALPLDDSAADAQLAAANGTGAGATTRRLAPGETVNVTRPLTVLGWPGRRPSLLDLNNSANLVSLVLPGSQQQLTLQRMTLTGIGVAGPTQQAASYRNLTSSLWLFNFDRRQSHVALNNVTLVVPQSELEYVQGIANGSMAAPGAAGSLVAPDAAFLAAGAGQRQSSWATGRVRTSTPGQRLELSSINYNGIQASDLVLTSALDSELASSLMVTQPPQNLTYTDGSDDPAVARSGDAGAAGSGGETAAVPSQPADGGGGRRGLRGWEVAVVVFSSVIAAALLGLLAWCCLRKRRRDANLRDGSNGKLAGEDAIVSSAAAEPPDTPGANSGPFEVKVVSVAHGDPASPVSTVRTSAAGSQGTSRSGSTAVVVSAAGSRQQQQQEVGRSSHRSQQSSAAPDDEIRQLVNTQRERAQQGRQSSGITSHGSKELEGVKLESVLGQGSFGVVYLGKWRGMRVAVKALMFHDSGPAARRARQRAVNEAAVNTLLSHECICNMYAYDLRPIAATGLPDDRFSSNYRLYIIQEYCDAGSLSEAIDKGAFMDQGRRNEVAILEVALQIAMGLEYIHSNNVIHGDLSSGNVMLRTAPETRLGIQAKLCDFGLSRFLEGPEHSHISNARQGTPFYMAPEVLAHGIISREADVFSLGVILWELYNAVRPPWRDPGQLDTIRKQIVRQLSPSNHTSPMTSQSGKTADRTGSTGGAGDSANTTSMPFRPLLALSGTSASSMTCPLPPDCPPPFLELVSTCIHPIPKVRPRMSDVVKVLQRVLGDLLANHPTDMQFLPDAEAATGRPSLDAARARSISWGSVAARGRTEEKHKMSDLAGKLRPAQSALLSGAYAVLAPAAPAPGAATAAAPDAAGGGPAPPVRSGRTLTGDLSQERLPMVPAATPGGSLPAELTRGYTSQCSLECITGSPPNDHLATRAVSCPPGSLTPSLADSFSSSFLVETIDDTGRVEPRLVLHSEPLRTQQYVVWVGHDGAEYAEVVGGGGGEGSEGASVGTANLFDSVEVPSDVLHGQ